VTIDGSDINIDFTGTSDQVNGGINCPAGNTRAVTAYVIKCMMIPDIGYVEGIFNPITVDAPEGSIVNPDRPAATDGRHITCVRSRTV
jgi:N-methylhydantoinase B/oxoprolinase/acetone carboxylase alpha subunit